MALLGETYFSKHSAGSSPAILWDVAQRCASSTRLLPLAPSVCVCPASATALWDLFPTDEKRAFPWVLVLELEVLLQKEATPWASHCGGPESPSLPLRSSFPPSSSFLLFAVWGRHQRPLGTFKQTGMLHVGWTRGKEGTRGCGTQYARYGLSRARARDAQGETRKMRASIEKRPTAVGILNVSRDCFVLGVFEVIVSFTDVSWMLVTELEDEKKWWLIGRHWSWAHWFTEMSRICFRAGVSSVALYSPGPCSDALLLVTLGFYPGRWLYSILLILVTSVSNSSPPSHLPHVAGKICNSNCH